MSARKFLPLLLILVLSLCAIHAGEVRGVVFEDRDADGTRDRREPGIGGVLVSNGVDVVSSDKRGRYSLEIGDNGIVFITKPSGYAVPLNEDNLPRHYYLHDPEGRSKDLNLRYPGVEPTGPLPESVDFPLHKAEESGRFEVIWFSDPQPEDDAEIDYIRDDVVAELVGVEAAFGMTVGDIMYNDLSLFPRYNRIISRIGIPWYNVAGNHDLNFMVDSHDDARETFKKHFGPPYYSFDYGKVHFIALDTVHYLGQDKKGKKRGKYVGAIDDNQLTWLANDLALVPQDRLVVLAMHIPVRSALDQEHKRVNILEKDRLFRILDKRRNLFMVTGHMHTAEHHYFDKDDGWSGAQPLHQHIIAAVSGSWWSGPVDERGIPTTEQRDGTPNGYYVMSINGARFTMRFKAAGKPANYQMRIMRDAEQIVVNLFDGGPKSTVKYRIDDGEMVAMKRESRNDPFMEEIFSRHEKTFKSFVELEPSSHIWTSPLPETLDAGVHTISVEAVDDYEQRHLAHMIVEIADKPL